MVIILGKNGSHLFKITHFLQVPHYFRKIETKIGDLILLARVDSTGEPVII